MACAVPPFLRHARIASSRRSVAVAYFLAFLGLGVFLPYFPLYLDRLGYAGWQIGAIVGLQPMLRWTSALGWAHLADRRRIRRRLLVLAGLGGALVVVPLLGVRHFAAVAAVSTSTTTISCDGATRSTRRAPQKKRTISAMTARPQVRPGTVSEKPRLAVWTA